MKLFENPLFKIDCSHNFFSNLFLPRILPADSGHSSSKVSANSKLSLKTYQCSDKGEFRVDRAVSLPRNFHSRRYHRSKSRGAEETDHSRCHRCRERHPEPMWVTEQKEQVRQSLSDIKERGRPRHREDREHSSWFRSDAPSPRLTSMDSARPMKKSFISTKGEL